MEDKIQLAKDICWAHDCTCSKCPLLQKIDEYRGFCIAEMLSVEELIKIKEKEV